MANPQDPQAIKKAMNKVRQKVKQGQAVTDEDFRELEEEVDALQQHLQSQAGGQQQRTPGGQQRTP